MFSNRSALRAIPTLYTLMLSTMALAAPTISNNTTSILPMQEAGWACLADQEKGFDLNNDHFDKRHGYLQQRATAHGIRAEHVVCELGKPSIDHKVSEELKVLGYTAVSGEHILIYGKDITQSSNEVNALAVIFDSNGLARTMLWITPSNQAFTGLRISFSSNEVERFKGTYKLGGNDVFQQY